MFGASVSVGVIWTIIKKCFSFSGQANEDLKVTRLAETFLEFGHEKILETASNHTMQRDSQKLAKNPEANNCKIVK